MGCQRGIAQKVIDKKAGGFADTKIGRDTTVDGDHGRIETRTTTVVHDVKWLQEGHDWPGLKAVAATTSIDRDRAPPRIKLRSPQKERRRKVACAAD